MSNWKQQKPFNQIIGYFSAAGAKGVLIQNPVMLEHLCILAFPKMWKKQGRMKLFAEIRDMNKNHRINLLADFMNRHSWLSASPTEKSSSEDIWELKESDQSTGIGYVAHRGSQAGVQRRYIAKLVDDDDVWMIDGDGTKYSLNGFTPGTPVTVELLNSQFEPSIYHPECRTHQIIVGSGFEPLEPLPRVFISKEMMSYPYIAAAVSAELIERAKTAQEVIEQYSVAREDGFYMARVINSPFEPMRYFSGSSRPWRNFGGTRFTEEEIEARDEPIQ